MSEREKLTALRVWTSSGLLCATVMGPVGTPNGYVRVPDEHSWSGLDYDQCFQSPPCGREWCGHTPENAIDVHGGVTYASRLNDIVDLPDADADGWWFGWDTQHLGDWMPSPYGSSEGRKWSVDDVAAETERMASQLAGAA